MSYDRIPEKMKPVHVQPIVLTPHTNGGWSVSIMAGDRGVRNTDHGAFTNSADMLCNLEKLVDGI